MDAAARCTRRSLVLSAVEDESTAPDGNDTRHQRQQRRRILLLGPPKSGRTSLAMDVAYQLASSTTLVRSRCRGACRLANAVTTASAKRFETNHQSDEPLFCKCIAVALFLVRDAGISQDDPLPFPHPCMERRREQEVLPSLYSKESYHGGHAFTKGEPIWNPDILARIKVHHVTRLRDLMEYLWSLQSKPLYEQPWGGIIIDDLDRIILVNQPSLQQHQQNPQLAQHSQPTCKSKSENDARQRHQHPSLVMLQVLAVLVDTVNTLQRRSLDHPLGRYNPYLLVTMSEHSHRQYWRPPMSNWIPSKLVVKASAPTATTVPVGGPWTIQMVSHGEESERPPVCVQYEIVRSELKGIYADFIIAWKCSHVTVEQKNASMPT